eukprot:CAMPEP_0175937906 /NCGR_PEP_ID=MMETSP0108-20121206/22401_1 /TAXON_ID=195067 ORGANISM="Goniomonas pacifica, Strain CCMP1869" /NCGR_SAMPLE_ID=MMETSP0108 /ASSEMBLY_ACC=CAM_ASM_000204 /LENGTH=168 /DNA_ID=CAMNT_0017262099 /DNA_START=1 /DNA_END=503 /DNA_ORIENTATION=+
MPHDPSHKEATPSQPEGPFRRDFFTDSHIDTSSNKDLQAQAGHLKASHQTPSRTDVMVPTKAEERKAEQVVKEEAKHKVEGEAARKAEEEAAQVAARKKRAGREEDEAAKKKAERQGMNVQEEALIQTAQQPASSLGGAGTGLRRVALASGDGHGREACVALKRGIEA